MRSLLSALQSGDLAAAQKAYTSLSSSGLAAKPGGPLDAIGQALQNGDLPGARQAASAWQAARQAHGHHGGHHHHAAASNAAAAPPSTEAGAAPTAISGAAAAGSILDVLA